ncbi:Nramp family divalent metal transporter [Mangrovivirga sp. M17]|uniref:Nramp family divalent metal transporter n=1 Tax=Mangrovivirga halotolerans TaxID=2993936 RepID=A0ABT3RVS1_9BACT|nr:Nramp family divalent metal transporter [Mangrovivirga halotolerans]MCX2745883.1 Nramp family divalent metal transporter [Mangrovivirga halotolerans]
MLKWIKKSGPGAMVAAAFIGPGTVTTASVAGASFGYTLIWALVFSIFATLVVQEMSLRLGVIGKIGVGEAVRKSAKSKFLRGLFLILIFSAIIIGNTAYEGGNLKGASLGFPDHNFQYLGLNLNWVFIIAFIAGFTFLYFGKVEFIERIMVLFVVLMGLIFMSTAIFINPDWSDVFKSLFVPRLKEGAAPLVVSLIGTTVVPYNIFLHASSSKKKWENENDLSIARKDSITSIVFGGLITLAIIITSAAAYQDSGNVVADQSSINLGLQLEPVMGSFASLFVGLGLFFAGITSAVTAPLAAAYTGSEIFNFRNDRNSFNFRIVWMFVFFIGGLLAIINVDSVMLILFAQATNGILLPLIVAFLIWIMNNKNILGKHRNGFVANILGFIVLIISLLLGVNSISGVIQQLN